MKTYNLLPIKQQQQKEQPNNKKRVIGFFSKTTIPWFPFGHKELINYAFNANFLDLVGKKKKKP